MKRLLSAIILLLLSTTSSFSIPKNFDGKLGTGYAIHPERLGLNIEANHLWALDPYFAAGIQSGLFWVKWEEIRGQGLFGASVVDIKAMTNAYIVPILGIAQFRIAPLKEKIGVLPYATVGLGYSVMGIFYSDPSYTDTTGTLHEKKTKREIFGGYTWQAVVGAAYSPSGSKIDFILESGYVSSHLYHGNNDINMSRVLVNLGVRFPFD